MMDNQKMLKLFKKFAGDPLNLGGLLVTPVKVEPSPKTFRGDDLTNMYFRVTNPDDVPYFSPIVEDRIYDQTEDFADFVNERIEVYFVPSFKTGMYINEELGSKIQKVFNSIKVIEFTTGTPFIGYKRYKLFIESVGLSTGGWDSESYYILNNVKIKSAYKNGEPCDITEAKDEYTEVFLPDQDSYWETEHLYVEIDSILNEYLLFSDPYRNVVSYYDTKFVV